MTAQQLTQALITVLFVAVMIELLVALTLFHVRMFKEDRARKKAESHKQASRPRDDLTNRH